LDDAIDEFPDVFPHEGFASLKGHIQDSASIQFFKKPEPHLFGEIIPAVPRTRKMGTIRTPQVAPVCDGQIE
jgi:hypothetical protein